MFSSFRASLHKVLIENRRRLVAEGETKYIGLLQSTYKFDELHRGYFAGAGALKCHRTKGQSGVPLHGNFIFLGGAFVLTGTNMVQIKHSSAGLGNLNTMNSGSIWRSIKGRMGQIASSLI